MVLQIVKTGRQKFIQRFFSLSLIFIIKMFGQVSFVLDWIKKVMDGDDLNVENCGVTTARSGQGEGSWKEMGQKFFEGRQVWR